MADLRAGRPVRLETGGTVSEVDLLELEPAEAADFWSYFAGRFAGPARRYAAAPTDPSPAEPGELADGHPVFVVGRAVIEPDDSGRERQRPTWRRSLGMGAVTAVLAAGLNGLLVSLIVPAMGVDPSFQAVGVVPVVLFTLVGVLAAAVAFWIVALRSAEPVRTWRVVASIGLLVSWLPDLMLLVSPVTPMGTATPAHVLVLMALHIPAFLFAVVLMPRLILGPSQAADRRQAGR